MPVIELESESLQDTRAYDSDFTLGLKSAASDSDYSSTKGRLYGLSESRSIPDIRTSRSEGNHSTVKKAFTNFTESLSHSSEEFHDSVQKTFSSIASTFSRDSAGNSVSDSGYDTVGSHSENSHGTEKTGNDSKNWSEFVFPDSLRTRVSSLTSRSSYHTASSNDSSLSSRSQSPRMNSDRFAITVDNAGFVLRESSEEDSCSSASSSSVASWQETASRDRSLLDTIGESREEDEHSASCSGSDSGSDSGDDDGVLEDVEIGQDGIGYDYDDDDHTEFDSDVGLDDLGAVMLQIGSCHFEPESASLSYDDEEYSYSSGLFPPVVTNYLGNKENQNGLGLGDASTADLYSEAARNAIFQKQLKQRQSAQRQQNKEEDGIASFFTKAFSCGGGTY